MALARIITSSHACSRELALDLLARGYAVEIVSPDRIPDSLADLELRVDADPGNQLIANVKAHSGERCASIDFVHHLKAPMADFIRKPPQSAVEERFKVKAEATTGAEVFVEAAKPASKAASPIEVLSPDRGSNVVERGNSAPSRDKLPPIPAKATNHQVNGPSIVPAPLIAQLKIDPLKQHRLQSAASLWRAAITLATIILLATSLWFGMRQGGKASAKISGAAPAKKIETDSSKALTADSPNDPAHSSSAVLDLKSKSAGTASPASKTRLSSGRVKKSPKSADSNYVARDTVVYFDKRVGEEAAARTGLAKRLSKQQTHSASYNGGAVAANAVTFDDKGAPETVKQDSSVKSASPPN